MFPLYYTRTHQVSGGIFIDDTLSVEFGKIPIWLLLYYDKSLTYNTLFMEGHMRDLSEEECTKVTGCGAFSYITSFGLATMGLGIGFVFGGPGGAVAVATMMYGIGAGTEAIYEMSNEGRDSKRSENYDYSS